MALFHAHFSSEALAMQCAADVILPDAPAKPSRPLPCLWLLHGLSDDHTTWQRRTSIERYADACRLAVVMPCVHRGFYTDMAHGLKYWTFLSEELPARMRAYFPLSSRREDDFATPKNGVRHATQRRQSHRSRYLPTGRAARHVQGAAA